MYKGKSVTEGVPLKYFHCKFPFTEVEILINFNKVTFSIKKFIKTVYPLQTLFKYCFNGFRKCFLKTPLSRSIRQHKLSIYNYSIIFN